MSRSAAVVVVNYGAHHLLDRHLAALMAPSGVRAPGGDDLAVVVVDNWSGAAERAAVHDLARRHGWHVVEAPNVGFGGGVNRGVARAAELGCREVVLLNPDAAVSPDVARALAEHVREHPDDLVCPRIEDSTGRVVFAGVAMSLSTGRMLPPQEPSADVRPWLTGACLAASVDLLQRLGGFRDDYFLYWEDVDLSFRAAQAGARLVVRTDLLAVHDEGGTHGRADAGPAKSNLYYRWNTRNRLLFAAHNLPPRLAVRWLLATPAESWAILLRGGRRQLVHSPRPLAAAVAGSLAGAAAVLRALVRRPRASPPAIASTGRAVLAAEPPPVEVVYSADLDVPDWTARHAAGEVPDRWPYGLDRLPGTPAWTRRAGWTVRDRVLRRADGRFDWAVRVPAGRPALCWDERTGVPLALARRGAPVATGVIWLTDQAPARTDAVVRRALRRCVAVWALSSAQLDPLQRRWGVPAGRLHHVLFGVDETFWTPADAAAVPDTVLVVGNDRDRDHPLALAGAARVQRHRPGLRLTLVSAQAIAVADGLGRRLGAVPHRELADRYRAAAVVAVATRPNLHASGMTTVLEAMSCGRPVVASDTPGMADYVKHGETGLLVAPGDEAAFADALASLLADPDAAEAMGRAGRAAVEARFTSAHLAGRLAALVAA